jgi:hypothetical protein
MATSIESIVWLNVDMMYGIEYEEFPARIAEVAMWLIDHQMNMQIGNEFGQYFARLPLKKSAKIVHGNALQIEWGDLLKKQVVEIESDHATLIVSEPLSDYQTVNIKTKNLTIIDERKSTKERIVIKDTFDYVLGNPPFIGKSIKSEMQKEDMEKIFLGVKGAGVLDYVAAWYLRAAQLIQNTSTKVAFVSSNSITQGEQVGVLWNLLLNFYKIKIHFAHRTFDWSNEARGNAAVHCVIIGFGDYDISSKSIFDYEDIKGEAHEIKAKNINPYLVDTKDIFIEKRRTPICGIPEISFGNMPNDGGYLIFSDDEKVAFLKAEPRAKKFMKPLLSAKEFLNNQKRWCLWLVDLQPIELDELKAVFKQIQGVKKHRLNSNRLATKKLADFPTLFAEIRQPNDTYILVPRVSSENRRVIPMSLFDKSYIVSDTCLAIPKATLFHFGVLQSSMHHTWVKSVCGRLKSDFRYSNEIVYNNYPFPFSPSHKQIKLVEEKSQKVLDARLEFPNTSLADMYDLDKMPPALVKAHNELDKAVDLAYRPQAFISEAKRMEFLFELYEKYTSNLFTNTKSKTQKA